MILWKKSKILRDGNENGKGIDYLNFDFLAQNGGETVGGTVRKIFGTVRERNDNGEGTDQER